MRNVNLFLILSLFSLLLSCHKEEPQQKVHPLAIKEIQNDPRKMGNYKPSRVIFENGKIANNMGYQLELKGELGPKDNPIYIFSGRECMECDAVQIAWAL